MKVTLIPAIVALAVQVSLAGDQPKAAKSIPAFDKLKSLEGNWSGKTSDGKSYSVTYKVVSAGTAVMETMNMHEDASEMITMYHPDGDKLMMTHYCSMGNQPRMKAKGLSKDGKTLAFTFVDVSNRRSPKESYMRNLVFTFVDGDHFTQEWTVRLEGKTDQAEKFEYERVK